MGHIKIPNKQAPVFLLYDPDLSESKILTIQIVAGPRRRESLRKVEV
jgi:hypothetical protein